MFIMSQQGYSIKDREIVGVATRGSCFPSVSLITVSNCWPLIIIYICCWLTTCCLNSVLYLDSLWNTAHLHSVIKPLCRRFILICFDSEFSSFLLFWLILIKTALDSYRLSVFLLVYNSYMITLNAEFCCAFLICKPTKKRDRHQYNCTEWLTYSY